jgi:hypothetical protein
MGVFLEVSAAFHWATSAGKLLSVAVAERFHHFFLAASVLIGNPLQTCFHLAFCQEKNKRGHR